MTRTSSVSCGAFITAYNPLGKIQDQNANDLAHAELGELISSLDCSFIESAGGDMTGNWPAELSYFVLGMNLLIAEEVGRKFNQDAILWAGDDATPQLRPLR